MTLILFILLILCQKINILLSLEEENGFCSLSESCDDDLHQDENKNMKKWRIKTSKHLLYDMNHGEGFNLRRDVYVRMATLVESLGPTWTLVLPPWVSMPHWKNGANEENTFWGKMFDVRSLNKFISVAEFHHFLQHFSQVDVILALEHFADSFSDEPDSWHEHYSINDCTKSKYYAVINNRIENLFDDEKITYKKLVCVQIEGYVSTLKNLIEEHFPDAESILVSNAEVILHSNYGDAKHWQCRRSMRFASHLIAIGNKYREEFLNSNDAQDKTILDPDWRSMKRNHGDAIGGDYLAVHLRRGDFAKSRPNDVPDLECAVKQIHFASTQFISSNKVFISSDANEGEWNQLKKLMNEKKLKFFRFNNDSLSDGENAIVDQWIAAHAKLFIGTYDSTFSFRIQEEREILGFLPNTTFNALCARCDHRLMLKLCRQQSQWKILYND